MLTDIVMVLTTYGTFIGKTAIEETGVKFILTDAITLMPDSRGNLVGMKMGVMDFKKWPDIVIHLDSSSSHYTAYLSTVSNIELAK